MDTRTVHMLDVTVVEGTFQADGAFNGASPTFAWCLNLPSEK